jgi:hypothetical protein
VNLKQEMGMLIDPMPPGWVISVIDQEHASNETWIALHGPGGQQR